MGVSDAATYLAALQKVEAGPTFHATCNAIFYCIASCKLGVLDDAICFATSNASHCIAGCLKNCTVYHGL
jgi:hypothetical protein